MATSTNYDDEEKAERYDTLHKLSSKLQRLYEFIGSSRRGSGQGQRDTFFREFSVHLNNVLNVIGPSDIAEQCQSDNFFHRISLNLNKVIDTLGVSEDVRAKYRKRAMMQEILDSTKYAIVNQGLASTYIFGSSIEGSTTYGLHSDVDILHCYDDIPVVEDPRDAPVNKLALLMVLDDTKPGYVKLQKVVDKIPQTVGNIEVGDNEVSDDQGRICWKQIILVLKTSVIRNGPAITIPGNDISIDQDQVWSVRCKTIPNFAKEWLYRVRPYDWPSQSMLKKMESYGCFFVCVGHPKSCTKDREWRMSFSLQERELMTSLNPSQHKCYVLLKMIKKEVIQHSVGKSLSSYHCKTCLFYLVENSKIDLWSPRNLLYSIHACLRILLHWVEEENCPNYFIKEENMFDRLDKKTLKQVGRTLRNLLSGGVNFLSSLPCDSLGWYLKKSIAGVNLDRLRLKVKEYLTFYFYANIFGLYFGFTQTIYEEYIYGTDRTGSLFRASHILQFIEHTQVITEHKPSEVGGTYKHLIPHIHLTIARILASIAIANREETDFNETMNAFEEQIQNSEDCDLMSSRILTATVYLKLERLENCQEILQNCEASLSPHVIGYCRCHEFIRNSNKIRQYRNFILEKKLIAENASFHEFQRNYVAACMIFPPPESNLIHPALQYEMYSKVFTTSGSKESKKEDDVWSDSIVIDAKVYLYFLQYVCFSKTGDKVSKQKALTKLRCVANDPYENLGHRDTANNILSWVYLQEDNLEEAFKCLFQSLKLKPFNNAAKWHILILIHCLIGEHIIYDRKWFTYHDHHQQHQN